MKYLLYLSTSLLITLTASKVLANGPNPCNLINPTANDSVTLPCDTHLAQPVPQEISAMLMSPQFTKAMVSLQKTATTQGKYLRVSAFDVVQIGTSTYSYLYISYKSNDEVSGVWQAYGSLTSKITYSIEKIAAIDGLWFTPVAVPPGGATVGN